MVTTSLPHSPRTSCCRPGASGFFSLGNIPIPTRQLNMAALVRRRHICSSPLPPTQFLGLSESSREALPTSSSAPPPPPAAPLCARHRAMSIVPLEGAVIVPTLLRRKLRFRVKQGPIPDHMAREEVSSWGPVHPRDTRCTLHSLPTPKSSPDRLRHSLWGPSQATHFPAEQLGAHYLVVVTTLRQQPIAWGMKPAQPCLPTPLACWS